ncbi:MAG: hypothetical protein J6A77_03390 [Lachnospiraceae bacterium]|nr:hypothetical protein [Lachnospiraceae bacterium]
MGTVLGDFVTGAAAGTTDLAISTGQIYISPVGVTLTASVEGEKKMIQKHSILLWKKAESKEKNFEEIAKEAFRTLDIFQEYPWILRPNYLTVELEKDIKEFDWNYENFRRTLKESVNREDEIIFEDLGYCLSFFSSTNEIDASGFLMLVGNKNDKFCNVFDMKLPLSLCLYDRENADMIEQIFKKLVYYYKPFWGCVSNSVLSEKYGRFMEKDLPRTVHWLNYWSDSICSAIGTEKIQRIVRENEEASFTEGIFKIKNTAINAEAEDEMEYQMQLHNQLFS